jgi:hypothetical protein
MRKKLDFINNRYHFNTLDINFKAMKTDLEKKKVESRVDLTAMCDFFDSVFMVTIDLAKPKMII